MPPFFGLKFSKINLQICLIILVDIPLSLFTIFFIQGGVSGGTTVTSAATFGPGVQKGESTCSRNMPALYRCIIERIALYGHAPFAGAWRLSCRYLPWPRLPASPKRNPCRPSRPDLRPKPATRRCACIGPARATQQLRDGNSLRSSSPFLRSKPHHSAHGRI